MNVQPVDVLSQTTWTTNTSAFGWGVEMSLDHEFCNCNQCSKEQEEREFKFYDSLYNDCQYKPDCPCLKCLDLREEIEREIAMDEAAMEAFDEEFHNGWLELPRGYAPRGDERYEDPLDMERF